MGFYVITDTSANLPSDLAAERGLEVIPFSYYVNGREMTCTDTKSFDAESFYYDLGHGAKVTTSQVNPGIYTEHFRKYLEKGDVIYISMSSGISGSCSNALAAARELGPEFPDRRIEVIDTRGAALGEGLIALEAARLRDMGIDLDQAVMILNDMCERMFNVFTVDDLMFLRRGGRLSNLSAIVGTVLRIKPILKGSETGQIVAFAKVMSRKRSVNALASLYEKLVVDPASQTVGIVHAGCRDDADHLASLINKNLTPREILLVDYEPVTGSHVGPGALALFFLSKKGVRSTDSL